VPAHRGSRRRRRCGDRCGCARRHGRRRCPNQSWAGEGHSWSRFALPARPDSDGRGCFVGPQLGGHRRRHIGVARPILWRAVVNPRRSRRSSAHRSALDRTRRTSRADGFKRMVEAAGQRWPDGWVKGEGARPAAGCRRLMTPPPSFDEESHALHSVKQRRCTGAGAVDPHTAGRTIRDLQGNTKLECLFAPAPPETAAWP
jgi:hypothetical protein